MKEELIKQLEDVKADKLFMDLVRAIEQVEDPTEQLYAAMAFSTAIIGHFAKDSYTAIGTVEVIKHAMMRRFSENSEE